MAWACWLQQGVRFDPDMPQTIRLEFAKSNTKVSKPKQPVASLTTTHPTLMHPLTGRKYHPRIRFSTPFAGNQRARQSSAAPLGNSPYLFILNLFQHIYLKQNSLTEQQNQNENSKIDKERSKNWNKFWNYFYVKKISWCGNCNF